MVRKPRCGQPNRCSIEISNKQLRDAGNDLGHHQRRIDHRGQREAAAKSLEAHQRDRRQRAQHHGRRRGDKGNAQRQPRADISWSLCVNCWYQRVENPPQMPTSEEALNE
jgi:hypothetical protein